MPKRAKTSQKSRRVTLASKPGAAQPPARQAPPAAAPIQVSSESRAAAPWPLNDRYPLIIGQALNLTYIAQAIRTAITGYRMQLVDLLRELVQNDPHLGSVLRKRILSTANGRLEIVPADVEEDDPDHELAVKAADMVRREIARIPNLTQSLATLLWAIYYAISCAEIMWTRDADGWHVERLEFVHSRRLAYPDGQSWSLHVWDQGQVYGWTSAWGTSPTNSGQFGLRVADYPGKFIVYAPQLSADYPTREGLGIEAAIWAALKRIGARGAADYLERFAKGFMDVVTKTSNDQDPGQPREATDEDIALARRIAGMIGAGSGSLASHPDSIQINPKSFDGGSSAKLTWPEWIELCNSEQSKLVVGGTLGTDHRGSGGLGGSGTAEVQERGEVDLEQFDATTLGESLKRDLVTWLVRLNMPEALHVVPRVLIHVETDPDPKTLIANAKGMTDLGAPVDLEDLSDKTGIKLVPNESVGPDGKPSKKAAKPRRSFRSDVLDPSMVDPNLLSEEAKQQQADATAAQQALAQAKASAPTPGAPGEGDTGQDKTADTPTGKNKPKPANGKGKDQDKPTDKAKGKRKLDDDEAQFAGAIRLLLKDRPNGAVAQRVFDQLLEDFPAKALPWVLAADWREAAMVPLDEIDFSNRERWTASQDGKLQSYIDKRREVGGENVKPAVMVKTPGNPKILPVDGHHRTLAAEAEGEPVRAYVAEVQVDQGPWLELHALARNGPGGASYSSYSSYFDRAPAV